MEALTDGSHTTLGDGGWATRCNTISTLVMYATILSDRMLGTWCGVDAA